MKGGVLLVSQGQMNLTIMEVLRFGGLVDAQIVAGSRGIDNIVESISVLEVVESGIARWVIKNQLYITSFYSISAKIEMQKEVIKALHQAKGCGLVLCHFELYVKHLDQEIIDLCDSLNFPMIIAKSEVSYVEILNPIIEKLMNLSIDKSQLLLSAQSKLIELVSNESDLKHIFKNISDMFNNEILFFDSNNRSIYSKGTENKRIMCQLEHYLNENYVSLNLECGNKEYTVRTIEGKQRTVYPIKTNRIFYGFIISNDNEDNHSFTVEKIKNIAKICTLVYTKKNRMKEMEEIYTQNYFNDLIAWNFRNEDAALKAGLELGLNITEKSKLMAVTINSFQESKKIHPFARKYLFSQITERVIVENIHNIVGYKDKVIFVLLQKDTSTEGHELHLSLANSIIELCKQSSLGSVSIGISNKMHHFTEIPKAYSEALDAAVIGRNFEGENKVTRYSDLGFLTIIKEIKNKKNALEIASNLLKPLQDYDKHNHTNFCKTLDYLFRYNLEITLVAEKLYVHKNTVLYRKNKIIEILGKNPFEAPNNLNYLIAFAIDKI